MNKSKRLKRSKLKAKQLNLIRHARTIELSKTPRYIKIDVPIKSETDGSKPSGTELDAVMSAAKSKFETTPEGLSDQPDSQATNLETAPLADDKVKPIMEQKVVQNPAHLYLKRGFKPFKHLKNKKIFKHLKQVSAK